MNEIKVSRLGKACLTEFESQAIPLLDSYPCKLLLEAHNLGEVLMIVKDIPLPNVENRLWNQGMQNNEQLV